MPNYQELLDVVDENDKIIGQETRASIHKKGLLHREVHVWIYNDKGEVLFQRRGPDKDTYPNLLDVSVGGHISPNENSLQAAVREIKEEVGLVISPGDLHFLNKIRKQSHDPVTGSTNSVLDAIFCYRLNLRKDSIKIESGEATALEWRQIDKMFVLSDEEREQFVPSLVNEKYLEIYKKVKSLLAK